MTTSNTLWHKIHKSLKSSMTGWSLLAMLIGIAYLESSAFAQTRARAQAQAEPDANETFKPQGGKDPDPKVPGVSGFDTGVHEQAGTGGDIAYAEAGVLELGGSGSLDVHSNGALMSLRPTVGWFLVNNLQLSGILEMSWARVNGQNSAIFGLFGEPSYHIPLTNRLLVFGGLGLGAAFNDSNWGFALRPRLGLDILIGRSGVFKPSIDLTWSTTDLVSRGNTTLVGITTSFGVSFGYAVML